MTRMTVCPSKGCSNPAVDGGLCPKCETPDFSVAEMLAAPTVVEPTEEQEKIGREIRGHYLGMIKAGFDADQAERLVGVQLMALVQAEVAEQEKRKREG